MAKKAKSSSKSKKKAPKKAPKKAAKKPAAKKKPVKAAAKKKARKKKAPAPPPLPWREALKGESFVGVVDDFFGHISVIALTLQAPLNVGDKIHVRGHTTDMTETVDSMQVNHQPVTAAKKGDSVGIKTIGKCRAGDYVYRA